MQILRGSTFQADRGASIKALIRNVPGTFQNSKKARVAEQASKGVSSRKRVREAMREGGRPCGILYVILRF